MKKWHTAFRNDAWVERLEQDGHHITKDRRGYNICSSSNSVRNTQLYRTLFHEIGHWVQWQNTVLIPDGSADNYYHIPESERETFAHRYAEKIRQELIDKKIIPYDRKRSGLEVGIKDYFVG